MIKIKRTPFFKFISLILALLFIFQTDFLASLNVRNSDTVGQLERAKQECEEGKYHDARRRLERLLRSIDRNKKELKDIVEVADNLLRSIIDSISAIRTQEMKQLRSELENGNDEVARQLYKEILSKLKKETGEYKSTKNKIIELYLEIAEAKCDAGNYTQAHPLVNEFVGSLEKEDSSEKNLIEKSKLLLVRIKVGDTRIIERLGDKNKKKKKKKKWLLWLVGVVVGGALAYLLIKGKESVSGAAEEPPNFHIESTPSSVKVYVDNLEKGNTPIDLYLVPGDHEVRLERGAWGEAKRSISIKTGKKYDVDVVLSPYKYNYQTQWGTRGTFSNPSGVAVDKSKNVYVTDTGNHRVKRFDASGSSLDNWGVQGTDDSQFQSPLGIGVSPGSLVYVYVADTDNNRIQKFTEGGRFEKTWGSDGGGDRQFRSPTGVAVNSSNFVFVVDCDNNQVKKYDRNGSYQDLKWGGSGTGQGKFDAPCGIDTDSDNNVYVVDTGNHRIQKFSPGGIFRTQWGSEGNKAGKFKSPWGIAVNSNSGFAFVTDTGNHRVQKFTLDGEYVTQWGCYGSGNKEFNRPRGIALDSGGNIYIADSDNHRIIKFKIADDTEDNGAWTINTSNTAASIAGAFRAARSQATSPIKNHSNREEVKPRKRK